MKSLVLVGSLIFSLNAFANDSFVTATAAELGISKPAQCHPGVSSTGIANVSFDPVPAEKVVTIKTEDCKRRTVTVEGQGSQTYLVCGSDIARMGLLTQLPKEDAASIRGRMFRHAGKFDRVSKSISNHYFVADNNVCKRNLSEEQLAQSKALILQSFARAYQDMQRFNISAVRCEQTANLTAPVSGADDVDAAQN